MQSLGVNREGTAQEQNYPEPPTTALEPVAQLFEIIGAPIPIKSENFGPVNASVMRSDDGIHQAFPHTRLQPAAEVDCPTPVLLR
jgi:hypothetical protein